MFFFNYPFYFAGTYRYNLDPFEQCLLTLVSVWLNHIISKNAAGLPQLVTESACNFSVGQCQWICIACTI